MTEYSWRTILVMLIEISELNWRGIKTVEETVRVSIPGFLVFYKFGVYDTSFHQIGRGTLFGAIGAGDRVLGPSEMNRILYHKRIANIRL